MTTTDPRCSAPFVGVDGYHHFCNRLPHTDSEHSVYVATVQERYPEVEGFVKRMYTELEANAGKGDQAGWRTMSLREAWGEIAWHNAKMATAIKEKNWALVRELAADVANGAMMLDDILNQMQADQ